MDCLAYLCRLNSSHEEETNTEVFQGSKSEVRSPKEWRTLSQEGGSPAKERSETPFGRFPDALE